MKNSLVYLDIGSYGEASFPFDDSKNWKYIKKFIGFDPNYEKASVVDGRKEYYNYAIFDVDCDDITYYMCRDKENNSLFPPNKKILNSRHCRKRALAKWSKQIACRRLDTMIRDKGWEVDILKIDAHGSEYRIVKSCGKYLKNISAIHVEMWPSGVYEGAEGLNVIIDYLIANNFRPVKMIRRGGILKKGTSWIEVLWLNANIANKEKETLIRDIYEIKKHDSSKCLNNLNVLYGETIMLPQDKLIELYKKTYLIRRTEEVITENYGDDEMKTPMHMSKGSEAISAGICAALNENDQVFGTYRSHAPYLSKTDDLKGFFAEMYGKKDGICEGKSGSMHLCNIEKGYMSSSAIVASNIPVAVGTAFANKMKGNGKRVVVFFGEGAMDEGNFWESINMASLWSLPVLFVCEDNRLAVHTHARFRQGYGDIMGILQNFNMVKQDGNGIDAEEVYKITKRVLEDMAIYEVPGFIQLQYFRFLEHVGISDDMHESYRQNDVWTSSDDNDPVLIMKKRMNDCNIDVSEIESEIERDIAVALNMAKESKFAPVNELYKSVYYD